MSVSVPDTNTQYKGTATKAFTITPKEISATLAAQNKTYDGNTNATATATLEGVENADKDNVEVTVSDAKFASEDADNDKQVSATVSLSGSAAKNYTLSSTTVSTTANIEQKTLTIENLSVADKTYDGTTSATISTTPTLKGIVEGDTVTLTNGTPTFASSDAAQNITINFTDFSLGGTDAANYTLTQPTGITANINTYTAVKGSDYSVNSNNWLNGDFVITPKKGWKLSYYKMAGGEWMDTIVISDETNNGVIGFYLKNMETGIISEEVVETYMIDKTAPAISGAENGKTYCDAVTLTITDDNLDNVTLNGQTVTLANNELTLNPAEGTQTVIATDKAGNSTSITVTVNNGHTWGDWTSNDDGTHTRTCLFDESHTQTASCHGGMATCKDRAVCEDCKAPYGELDPQNHADLKHVEAKAATTEAEGNIEYWYCDACDKYYKDADATEEITKADTVIAKLESASTKNKSTKTKDEGTANTSSKTGNTTNTTKASAKTGDESTMLLWIALFLVSGGTATTTILLSRKKKRNK